MTITPKTLTDVLQNAFVTVKNTLAELPGERPEWLVMELGGSYPARKHKRKLNSFPPDISPPAPSLESLEKTIDGLIEAPWLRGVVFRFADLHISLATAYALRRQLQRLREAGKQTVVYATQLDSTGYYLATIADEIIMPEGADLSIAGFALETTFMRDALARFGVSFDKLAIREYKNAGDNFARSEMSEAQREQYSALLDSFTQTLYEEIAEARAVTPATVTGWYDRAVTSAAEAKTQGMIDAVRYEDELVTKHHKPWQQAGRFLKQRRYPPGGRVAVIALEGVIMTGKSRRSPLPLPLIGGAQAGSETIIKAFRRAEADDTTEAIVFYVDSGGGSALASDLIWREVVRIGKRKPVIAVMGQLAASGGYYVLTHAQHVIAAPSTITGSIGVFAGKFVLEDFNARYGFNPEAIRYGRYAQLHSPNHPFDEEERAKLQASIEEVYQRFTSRVADGRKLSQERVDEIGRGHIWSGQDALDIKLVDELGDVALGVERAREAADLPADAPVWNVEAPSKLLLPTSDDPSTLLRTLAPFRRERIFLLHLNELRINS